MKRGYDESSIALASRYYPHKTSEVPPARFVIKGSTFEPLVVTF